MSLLHMPAVDKYPRIVFIKECNDSMTNAILY